MFLQGKCREGINWNSFVFKIICEASKLCLLASVLQLWGLELFAFLITFLIPMSKYLVLCIYRVGKLIHQGFLILPQSLKSFPQENMSNLKLQRTYFLLYLISDNLKKISQIKKYIFILIEPRRKKKMLKITIIQPTNKNPLHSIHNKYL